MENITGEENISVEVNRDKKDYKIESVEVEASIELQETEQVDTKVEEDATEEPQEDAEKT